MSRYLNSQMRELRNELRYAAKGAARLQVERIRKLLPTLSPSGLYPYEFIVTQITGFRPQRATNVEITGEALIPDLLRLLYDISGRAALRTDEVGQRVFSLQEVCQRFGVSARTVARWRENGLVAMKFIWPDGARRTGFEQSDLEAYLQRNAESVARASRFSRISDREREILIERAKFHVRQRGMTLSEVTQFLSDEHGRSREAVRYTLLRHDRENPDDPIFPRWRESLTLEQAEAIHEAFRSGVSVASLARRFNRTPSAIYQIIRLARARKLLARQIEYMPHPLFESKTADQDILGLHTVREPGIKDDGQVSKQFAPAPPEEKSIYGAPPLSAEEEREVFLRYNYLKFKAARLQSQLLGGYASQRLMNQLESLMNEAERTREQIVRHYLRLVVAVARRHVKKGVNLSDLISEGNYCLLRAVEKFDVARKNRFSTYLTWALMKTFARSAAQGKAALTNLEEVLSQVIRQPMDNREPDDEGRTRAVGDMLNALTERERAVVASRFGLGGEEPASYGQIGRMLGVTRERARQVVNAALRKLREQAGAVKSGA